MEGLDHLAARVRADLAALNHPPANWVPPRPAPNGEPCLDVLVIGAGMCGQTASFALLREGVTRIRTLDRAPRGEEGPWGTFARMETLRSPKHLTGPDLGVPSLTFRAWWEVQHGAAGWQALYKVPRLAWRDYLLFVREAAAIPVENDTEVLRLFPAAGLIGAEIAGPGGREIVHARKVVLACGRKGSGGRRMPAYVPPGVSERIFHSSDPIDFGQFRGGHIAVLGASASAIDNAATALEAGVAQATLFVRRNHFPQVNKSKGVSFPGFLRGYAALDDRRRWEFMTFIMGHGTPPPHESVLRCARHPGFSVRFGEGWTGLAEDRDGVTVETAKGQTRVDAAIVAIGFDIDLVRRHELAPFRDAILTWGERVPAAAAVAYPEAARFPYLGDGFQLLERVLGTLPELAALHVFNWGVTMSHGQLAGDIPGLAVGATRLAHAISRDLFVADADIHHAAMLAQEDDELAPTAFFVPREAR